ncbi:MAG: alcohol dehydrogenase family protein [Desulfobacterales bacterium]|nr:alcohol dehydrogenase family protein [Desulfobacterales bacterium]MDJ0889021.1 alcohol dehydrogenase family protein [Desulfobacterales bacterium]MDJ0989709.1 alcohol dehydrogenase family protein [Desulfobacterales bacterium]
MGIPNHMQAVLLTGHGGFERLEIREDAPVPRPAPGEVLIAVGASGMNNTDINTRIGWYSQTVASGTTSRGAAEGMADMTAQEATWGSRALVFPRIQGADVAGRIAAVGRDVSPRRIGERVLVDPWLRDPANPTDRNRAGYLGSERDGGFAQFVTVPAENAFAIQCDLTDAELATFPCAYSTAEHMLHRVDLRSGERIVITGASGGVGSALVQLAKRRGAWVLALTSPDKNDQLARLGAEAVVDRRSANLGADLEQSLPEGGCDVVADVVGGECFPTLLNLLCRGGRYVTSGAIAGPIVELDLRTLYLKDLAMHGATVMPPGIFARLVKYIENQEIRPLLAAEFELEDIHDAQKAFLEKKHCGNIVLRPRGISSSEKK